MAKRKIDGGELVKDIRARMTDLELMQKYRLSPRGLDSALKKLVELKAITQAEYDWRPADYDDTAAITQLPSLDDLDDLDDYDEDPPTDPEKRTLE